jgi:hypothetical protein
MYDRLAKTKQPTVLFKGYDWLAKTEGQRGDRVRQRAAWNAAWPHVPPGLAGEWGGWVLLGFWNQREDTLLAGDKKLARAIARRLLAEVEADAAATDAAELHAFWLRCAACGLAVSGKLLDARKAIDRALALQPDDPDLVALHEQLRR